MDSKKLAQLCRDYADNKKAENIAVLDVRKLSSVTDFFVIVTADSERKAKAAAEHIVDELKEDGERPMHVEGMDSMHWILMDYIDVVVHIFMPNERRFYDLESLWSDAPIVSESW